MLSTSARQYSRYKDPKWCHGKALSRKVWSFGRWNETYFLLFFFSASVLGSILNYSIFCVRLTIAH